MYGSLIVKGETLKYGLIKFHGAGDTDVVNAQVRDDGSYNLRLEPGEYIVTVKATPPYTRPEGVSPESIDASQIPKSPVHPGYGHPKSTPLKYEVILGQENKFDIKI